MQQYAVQFIHLLRVWVNTLTFWRLHAAFGLVLGTLLVLNMFASHYFLYRFQVALTHWVHVLGVGDKFVMLAMLVFILVLVIFFALRTNFAAKLHISRFTLCALLAGNTLIFLDWVQGIVFDIKQTQFSYGLSMLLKLSLGIGIASFVFTLLWKYVIQPFPKARKSMQALFHTPSGDVNQASSHSKFGIGIVIVLLMGLAIIVLHQFKDNVQVEDNERSTNQSQMAVQLHFANWRNALDLTQPAIAAEQNHDWALAIKEWSKLLSKYPNDPSLLQRRMTAYQQLGLYPLALADAKEIVELSKNNAEAWHNLCWNSLLAKQFNQTRNACIQAQQLDPWEIASTFNLAHAYLLSDEPVTAQQWYAKAVTQLPSEAVLQELLRDFTLFEQLGIRDAALTQAKQAFAQQGEAWLNKLAPAIQHLHVAQTAEAQGNTMQALTHYQQNLSSLRTIAGANHSQTLLATKQLALFFSSLGRNDESLSELAILRKSAAETLGENHPQMVDILNTQAYVLHEANKLAEAEKAYTQTLTKAKLILGGNSPQIATALNGLGNTQRKLGNFTTADSTLHQSVNLTLSQLLPDYQLLGKRMNNLGLFYYEVGSINMAEYCFNSALEMTEKAVGKNHPDNFWRLHNLFKIAMRKQDYTGAKTLLNREVEIAKRQSDATYAEIKNIAQEDVDYYLINVPSFSKLNKGSEQKR